MIVIRQIKYVKNIHQTNSRGKNNSICWQVRYNKFYFKITPFPQCILTLHKGCKQFRPVFSVCAFLSALSEIQHWILPRMIFTSDSINKQPLFRKCSNAETFECPVRESFKIGRYNSQFETRYIEMSNLWESTWRHFDLERLCSWTLRKYMASKWQKTHMNKRSRREFRHVRGLLSKQMFSYIQIETVSKKYNNKSHWLDLRKSPT